MSRNSSNRDPQADKKRDLARQRKIVSGSSDKAARTSARMRKTNANRKARHQAKIELADANDLESLSVQDLVLAHKTKDRHWGTINSAEQRILRDNERAFLDATPSLVAGRQRHNIATSDRLSAKLKGKESDLRDAAAKCDAKGLSKSAEKLRDLAERIERSVKPEQ